MMQAIWDAWEQGTVPEFRSGPCRVHEGPHTTTDEDTGEQVPMSPLDRGGSYIDGERNPDAAWEWLHKNLCMRFSPELAKTPSSSGKPGLGGAESPGSGAVMYDEHCMYSAQAEPHKRAKKVHLASSGSCGVDGGEEE